MAILSVTRGYTFQVGVVPSVDDYNAAAMPTVEFNESIAGEDLAAGAVGPSHLATDVFSGLTQLSAFAADDSVPVYDLSGAVNARVTGATLAKGLFSFGTGAVAFTAFGGDLVTFYNGTGAATMSVARFFEQALAQATALTGTVSGDKALVWDASASDGDRVRAVELSNLLPDTGFAAGDYAYPASITTDAKGRVTSVVPSTNPGITSLPAQAIPNGSTVHKATFAHGLPAVPRSVRAVMRCVSDDTAACGHGVGVELEVSYFTTVSNDSPSFSVAADVTNVYVIRVGTWDIWTIDPRTGTNQILTPANWQLAVYVRL